MPGQYAKRRTGLKPRTPRAGVTLPGVGGYDYPRGPYAATGFPGSAPAAQRTHTQGPDGRKDPSYLGNPRRSVSGQQADWSGQPARTAQASSYRGGLPELVRQDATEQQPKSPWAPTPGVGPDITGRTAGWDFPARVKALSTGPERRMTPVIGGAPGSQNVRNSIAQRYKARPELVRGYRPSPNPGMTGAYAIGPAQYHPATIIQGEPDGKPVPGMASQPGPPEVFVQSRYVSPEGSQEGYAMDRPLMFDKGGVAAYPDTYTRSTGNIHLRGGRLTGDRYFGALEDQARIGLDTDAYGISRARGPRHRPVSFTQPQPWTNNYYDVHPDTSSSAPDMIHQSPSRQRRGRAVRRG